jgi:adenosylcobinamide-GDP ribazoletransferase
MLTVLPVGVVMDPSRATARGALLLAPLAVAPLGVLAGLVLWLGGAVALPPGAVALLAIGALALATRALHLDGLSDVADGLTAPYGPERSLAIMKTGAAGPAGGVALVLVIGLQTTGLAHLAATDHGDWKHPLTGAACVLAARFALWITASSLVPPARPDGLGLTFTRTFPVWLTALGWGALAGVAALVDPVRGPVTVGVAAVVVAILTWRCTQRFGGVTGDVFGAAIELTFAVLVLGAATF